MDHSGHNHGNNTCNTQEHKDSSGHCGKDSKCEEGCHTSSSFQSAQGASGHKDKCGLKHDHEKADH